ncbi:MAG: PD40 domain-containing protein [Oligoflexales bacterium]|nr:PD40 domain-containing protein [Oligoflexales bacterium]
MLKIITSVLLLTIFFPRVEAAPLINISNPNFRKLIVGVPVFQVESTDQQLKNWSNLGSDRLSYYLNFSGIFSTMDATAYQDIMPGVAKAIAQGNLSSAAAQLSSLKLLGMDCVVFGVLKKSGEEVTLEIQTYDFAQSRMLLGKKFQGKDEAWFIQSLKVYGNHILKEYTGLEGIFTSKIAFTGKKSKGSVKQLYISDFDGSNVQKLTDSKLPVLSPAWSPDGRYVLFTAYTRGNPDIYQYDTRTGKIQALATEKGMNSGGSFSPDGKLMVYTASAAGDTDLFIRPVPKGSRSLFISGGGLDVEPKFSPDGNWIAYVSGRFGNPHIFRASITWPTPSTPKVVSDMRLTYAGWYNAAPAWSPDSTKLAFAGYDKEIDRFDLFLMNHDGSNLERLTLKSGDNENPSWAPNGQLIAFSSNRVGNQNIKKVHQLYMMRRDGSQQKLLETGLYEVSSPIWGPNL